MLKRHFIELRPPTTENIYFLSGTAVFLSSFDSITDNIRK